MCFCGNSCHVTLETKNVHSLLFILCCVACSKYCRICSIYLSNCLWCRFCLTANGLQLQEVGDFGDENCLPPLNLIRSTKLHLPIVPPISCRCCYAVGFLFLSVVSLSFTAI